MLVQKKKQHDQDDALEGVPSAGPVERDSLSCNVTWYQPCIDDWSQKTD